MLGAFKQSATTKQTVQEAPNLPIPFPRWVGAGHSAPNQPTTPRHNKRGEQGLHMYSEFPVQRKGDAFGVKHSFAVTFYRRVANKRPVDISVSSQIGA